VFLPTGRVLGIEMRERHYTFLRVEAVLKQRITFFFGRAARVEKWFGQDQEALIIQKYFVVFIHAELRQIFDERVELLFSTLSLLGCADIGIFGESAESSPVARGIAFRNSLGSDGGHLESRSGRPRQDGVEAKGKE
jgi:hypothetical protein